MSKDNKRLSKENKNLDYKLKHQVERNVIVVNQVRNLKGQIKELKANIVEKEPHLDYLQRTNDQLFNSLEEAKDAYVDGFKSFKDFKDVLDQHNTAGFEDFH